MKKPVLVGIGNELNGDDGVGVAIARELAGKAKKLHIFEAGTQPENFASKITALKPSHVIFVDAASLPVGRNISIVDEAEIGKFPAHTHYMSLGLIIKRILNKCNPKIVIIGIRPLNAEPGSALTEPVRKTADELISLFLKLDKML